jgi:hypothetical protein
MSSLKKPTGSVGAGAGAPAGSAAPVKAAKNSLKQTRR